MTSENIAAVTLHCLRSFRPNTQMVEKGRQLTQPKLFLFSTEHDISFASTNELI